MAVNEGNQFAKKLTTPELCQMAYKSYCAHLAKGKSRDSWNMKEPIKLTAKTLEVYIKENPTEFPSIDKDIAKTEGLQVWEQVVEDSASGKNRKANTASLQMLMRNKFGWDKQNHSQVFDTSALQASAMLLDQVKKLQALDLIANDTEKSQQEDQKSNETDNPFPVH